MSDTVTAPKKLGHKIRSAYLWVTASNLLQNLVGFGISIVLARLLQPSDYGLVGMVIIFIAILSKVQELGFGQALVHFDEDPTMLPTYFTVTTLMALLLTVALISGAPAIANFYHEPRLTPVLRALSFSPLLAGLQVVPNAILTKAFRFRTLSYRDLLSTVAAGTVSIMLAFRGFGVWALVANMLVWGFIQAALLLYLASRMTSCGSHCAQGTGTSTMTSALDGGS